MAIDCYFISSIGNKITGPAFAILTESHLVELGVSFGAKIILLELLSEVVNDFSYLLAPALLTAMPDLYEFDQYIK